MAEGPWQSSAGNSPAPAPGMPGAGGSADPGTGSAEPAAHSADADARSADPARAPGPASPRSPAEPFPGDGAYPAYPIEGPVDLEPDYTLSDYPLSDYPLPDYTRPADPFEFEPDRIGRRRPWDLDSRGRRLLAGGLAIALSSALVGGLLGGWIATRSQGISTVPGYRLGPAPRALTNRPATSVAGIAARVLPSVVMIRVNGGSGTGSGFAVRGGYIVTDNHVVTLDGHATHTSLQVVFRDGMTVPGRLVGRDTYSDIAVIKPVGVHGPPALPLGNSGGLDVGDPVIAFGAPLGLAGTVTSGIVSSLERPVQPGAGNGPAAPQVFLEAIQTDAPINPGNSGGPLVNAQGQVVGVNAAFDTLGGNVITGQGGNIGLGFAIPINQVRRVAAELIRTGHATHSVIGALLNTKFTDAGAEIATATSGAGPAVTPGGPAGRAGLRAGDVIVSFDDQPVTSAQTLLDAIRAQPPGTPAHLTYLRHGRSHAVALRLGSAPS
jgi:S1-C subfamily serine protease